MIFRNLAEVIPAKPVFAGAADRFDLKNVVGMKTKIVRRAARKGIEDRLAELQQKRAGHQSLLPIFVLFGEKQPHLPGRS